MSVLKPVKKETVHGYSVPPANYIYKEVISKFAGLLKLPLDVNITSDFYVASII